MEKTITFEQFKELFADYMGLDESTLTRETNILTDLGVDSLSLVNTMFRLEKKFNVQFRAEDKIMTRSLGEAYDLLVSSIAKREN